jgi:hypothetical protein
MGEPWPGFWAKQQGAISRMKIGAFRDILIYFPDAFSVLCGAFYYTFTMSGE